MAVPWGCFCAFPLAAATAVRGLGQRPRVLMPHFSAPEMRAFTPPATLSDFGAKALELAEKVQPYLPL